MTKLYLKTLTVLLVLFISTISNSQPAGSVCVTCADDDILITCGETAQIFGDGYITSSFSDDFNSWATPTTPNTAVWNSITPGGTTGNSTCTSAPTPFANCSGSGIIAAGNYLWFPHGSSIPRQATTIAIDVSSGGDLAFEYKMEAQAGPCDGPDLALEGTMIQYSINFGATWVDMPANFFPFNANPAPYTNIAYFSPLNPQLQTFTSWNQYSIPIPFAAQTANTIFRWSQTSASSTQYDFWGLENLNIITTPPGGSAYQWEDLSTGIITLGQTLIVSPTVLTNYEFTYTSSSLSCSTTVEVDVANPIVDPVNLGSGIICGSSTDLEANVSFNTCNYKIYLYDNGGDGWVTIPQTSSSIDNRLEVYVDGILVSTITMNPPGLGPNPYGPGTDQYGPVIYSFPISATPGSTFETKFLSSGLNTPECAYFITDNQGNLLTDGSGNVISAMGLMSSPGLPPAVSWPLVPGSTQAPPSPGWLVQPLDFGPITPSCPTTNLYSYSWEIATGPAPGGVGTGSTVGITPPNTQTTNVVTSINQDYMVTVTDLTNAGCTANAIIGVTGVSAATAAFDLITSPACEGCIDLSFSGLTPIIYGPDYTIVVEMIDATGVPNISTFTINGSGNITGIGGSPINLCPTISTSSSSTSVTFNITSFIDNGDPNGCEIPINNASQTVTFSTQPDAGTLLDINPSWNLPNPGMDAERTFCSGDPTIDFATLFSVLPNDANGEWTYISGAGPAPSMPYTGLNYMFDPSTDPPGVYRYTVVNSPCSDDYVTLEIILDPGPIAGSLPPMPVDMCIGNVLNLNNEFLPPPAAPPTPYTPVWTNVTSGLPGFPVSNNFFPPSSGPYKFRSTITDPTSSCPPVWAEVDILVHDLPTVSFSTVSQICLLESLDLSFVLTGAPPFTITISDNVNPPFNVVVDANGDDNLTGNPITYTPASAVTYNLSVTNISDNNFCSTTISGENSVVNVLTPPSSGGPQTFLSVCSDDPIIYDLSTQLDGTQDGTGYWIDADLVQQPSSPSFNFDVSMPGGDYTYVVTSPICITAQTIVTVAVIPAPITGSANPQDICINDYPPGSLYNLDNLLSGSYDPGTWYESGVPIPTNIDPNTYGLGPTTFKYQVNGTPPCSNGTINVDLTINPEPVVASFTSSAPSTTQGYAIGLDVTMSAGTPPFTIDLYDDDSPVNTGSIFTALGMSGSVNMMPNVLPTTTYAISLITDANGCTINYNGTVPVDVVPYPIVAFSTLTTPICENQIATIEFDLVQGVVPVTVNYVLHGNSYTETLNSVGVTAVNIPNANLNFGINNFSISSIIDDNGEAAPNIPNDIPIIYNQNPSATFSATKPEFCYKDDVILEFAFSAGTPPFTVRYSDNGIELLPALIFNNLGNQTTTLSPDPAVGNHPYDIIDIVDANLCPGTISNTEDIWIQKLPDLDIIISGEDSICFGDFSELSFPVLVPAPLDLSSFPYNLKFFDGSLDQTVNVNEFGLIFETGNPYPVNPSTTTTYTLIEVIDSRLGCKQSLSDSKTLIVNEIPVVDISGTTEICKGDYTNINFDFSAGLAPWTLSYNINGIAGTSFKLDSTYDSMVVSPTTTSTYTYTAIEDDNGCKDNLTDAATITVNPLPEMEVTGGGEVCDDGSTVDVIFNTSNGTPTFDFQYTVGLNTEYVSEVGYQHIISTNESGTYRVTNITDNKGCIGKSITGSADVIINPMPVADFSVYPQPADVTNPVIHFIDNSTGHIAGTWDFDDNFTANTNFGKLSHRFSDLDSGTYYVELYVESNKGCWDTQLQKVVIDNAFIFYIPNSFSPNNDMLNDIFMPYIDGVDKYDLYIYSRQGQEVFHTTDVNEGWDGYVADGDNYAIAGKYTYAIYIIDLHGKERNYQGNLSLFR